VGPAVLSVWDWRKESVGAAVLGSSLKRRVDGRVKPGHDENGRKRGPNGGSEKLTFNNILFTKYRSSCYDLAVATKSPRLASGGRGWERARAFVALRHGVAEERIFYLNQL
jgi:hypothetical protein